MPVFNGDGIIGSSFKVSPSDSLLTNLTVSGTLSLPALSVSSLTSSTFILQGTQTYAINVNTLLGAGYSLNLSQNNVTLTNTGTIPTIAAAYFAVSNVIGNGGLNVGDICNLYIAGPPGVTNLPYSGSLLSLKVDGNSQFTGNIAITGNLSLAGSLISTGAISTTGILTNTNLTNSTSAATGSVVLSGGLGVQQDVYVGGTVNSAGTRLSSGMLLYSTRSPITSGSPYTLNFAGLDNYVIIPIQSATGFTLNIPAGSNGQVLIIINLGAGDVSANLTVEGAVTSTVLSQTDRMSLVYYSGSWRSLV